MQPRYNDTIRCGQEKTRTMKRHVLLILFLLFIVCFVLEAYYIIILKTRTLELETELSKFTVLEEILRNKGVRYIELENYYDLSAVPRMYAAKGELDKALAWADLYVNLRGDRVLYFVEAPLEVRGDIYYAMQNYQDAINDYSSAIDIYISVSSDSDSYEWYYLFCPKRGMAYKSLGNTNKAVDDFCCALRHAINNSKKVLAYFPPLSEDIYQYLEVHQDLLPDDLTLQEIKSFRAKAISAYAAREKAKAKANGL